MVMVYFATNRKHNSRGFTGEFSEKGLADLRYGFAEVTGQKLDKYRIEIAHEKIVRDKMRGRVDERRSVFGSAETMRRVRAKMTKHNRDTVVFVHGYNVSFRKALTAAARIKKNFRSHSGGKGVNVVLFSWPSDGSMTPWLAYASDRRDAAASGPAFGRAFLKLGKFLGDATRDEECKECVHLMAHSMGNYVLRHAVQEIGRQHPGRPPRIFDQVFLMAADEDDDSFECKHKLLPLPRLSRRVNVYFNEGDVALEISDKTKGQPDRLGTGGPRLPRQIPGKITSIDCTPVVGGLIEHSYYVESQRVVKDMLEVLAGKEPKDVKGRHYHPDSNRFTLVAGQRRSRRRT